MSSMAIRVDLQRTAELDEGLEFPESAWFDAVPRRGEIVQFRDARTSTLIPHVVIGVNYVESELNTFRILVVVK